MPQSKRVSLLRLAVLPLIMLAALAIAFKAGYFEMDRRREIAEIVSRSRGLQAIEVLYVAAYAVAVAVCLPAVAMTLLGGAFFGPGMGAVLAWLGAMTGTLFTHLLATRIMKKPLRRVFGEHTLLRRLRENDTISGLFRLRILPVAPFGVLDYVAGVAGVSLPRLLVATALGVVPTVIAYAYVGSQLIRGLASDGEASRKAITIAVVVTISMLAVSVVPGLVRRMKE